MRNASATWASTTMIRKPKPNSSRSRPVITLRSLLFVGATPTRLGPAASTRTTISSIDQSLSVGNEPLGSPASRPARNNSQAGGLRAAGNRHPLEASQPPSPIRFSSGAWGERRPIPFRGGWVESAALVLQSPPDTAGKQKERPGTGLGGCSRWRNHWVRLGVELAPGGDPPSPPVSPIRRGDPGPISVAGVFLGGRAAFTQTRAARTTPVRPSAASSAVPRGSHH
jgi:hypothetical protein